jgi:hypothetical protein
VSGLLHCNPFAVVAALQVERPGALGPMSPRSPHILSSATQFRAAARLGIHSLTHALAHWCTALLPATAQDLAWEGTTAGPIRTAPVQRWIEGKAGL